MQIIPVIDVRGGVAVRAVAGDRAAYQPLETPLAEGCDPEAVARGYQALYPFQVLYVADLDGIEGRGANTALQTRIAAAWTGAEIWIDDGGLAPGQGRVRRITASESLLAAGLCQVATDTGAMRAAEILSLDFQGQAFLGPPGLLAVPDIWPRRVIVMTLAAVGRDAGPDIRRVADVVRLAGPAREVYAAGGVRGPQDVRALSEAGAAGVLVASALHSGQIKTGDLEEIAGF